MKKSVITVFFCTCLSADVSTSPGPAGEGRKAPLVASDSSSSGGSDSEEDDKNAGAPPTLETASAPGNKTVDLKRCASSRLSECVISVKAVGRLKLSETYPASKA